METECCPKDTAPLLTVTVNPSEGVFHNLLVVHNPVHL